MKQSRDDVEIDFRRSSSPAPLLKAQSPRAGCQGLVQAGFEYLEGWRPHELSVQCFDVWTLLQ